ncbi:hypothetical protein NMG60_11005765 [Bertholletia excelsa]
MMSAEIHGPTGSPVQRSPWHSPVPYLFGGLAAMLGLIAFALLILACSYWKLSGYLDGDNATSEDRDVELGDSGEKPKQPPPAFEEKYLVIMAGQEKPTFLAKPVPSRASSFGPGSAGEVASAPDREKTEGAKEGGVDPVQSGSTETRESLNQVP